MCSECYQMPCHPRCPNAPDPPVVHICANCGEEIHEGDECWDMADGYWCEECIDNRHTVAECE